MLKCIKLIKELVEFINDTYLSLVQYVLNKFLTGICVVSSIIKIIFFLKKSPLCSLCKLCHKTDCHLFDEGKHNQQ